MQLDSPPPAATRGPSFYFLLIVAIIALGIALKALHYVLMPATFALFTAILVYPLQKRLNFVFPAKLQWLSTVVCMLLILVMILTAFAAVGISVQQVARKAPDYAETFRTHWYTVQDWARERGVPLSLNLGDSDELLQRAFNFVRAVLVSSWALAGGMVLIFFLVLLMLLESNTWRAKILKLSGDNDGRLLTMVRVTSHRLRQYLGVMFFISAISGIAHGLWLWVIGVDFAFLWGLLTFVLNFIPNVGSIVAVIGPSIVALVQLDPGLALTAIAGMILLEQFIGNFLAPRMQGRRLQISPLVLLIALVFWTWMWGIGGALLAVPITVTLVIVFSHVESLRPVALLLSSTSHFSVLDQSTQETGAEAPGD